LKRVSTSAVGLVLLIVQLAVLVSVPRGVSAYTPHTPIYINGNGGFNASNGVTGGSGLPSDPYVIEGWDINSTGTGGMGIENTDAHFVIRNVYVHSDPISPQGIAFRNVKNGRIEGSTISNHYVGILIDRFTQNVSIIGNQISSNWEGLYSESNVTVEGNNFHDNRRGLFLYSGATVKNNDFVSNTHIGIDLSWSAFGGTISENKIEGNGNGGWVGGIVFENNSAHWTVSHNQIRYNNASGIFMVWGPSNITVEYNDISYNVGEGVHFEDVRDVTVAHNNFIGNAVPQAYDANGAVNRWDAGCSGGGNYWSDYSGVDSIDCNTGSAGADGFADSPYVIDADSKDDYPFMLPLNLSMNNTPPTVPVASPNGGESWAGDSVHQIDWWMSDDADTNLTVWIKYSTNGGATWIDIPGAQAMFLPVGSQSYSWTLPQINTSNALVKVIAMDSGGLTGSDQSDAVFTIYTTGPYIVTTYPADGQTNVPVDAPIVITFSEPMNTSAVTVAIVPIIMLTPSWSGGNTVLTLTHATPFSYCIMYAVTVYGVVPGPVPNPFHFSAGCPNPVILNTDPMDGQTDVALTAPIIVNFSASMNTTSVSISTTPTLLFSPSWWNNDMTVTYTHTMPFLSCTNYTVQMTGEDVLGFPLIPGPVPNPWTFSTCTFNPPSVSLMNPAGGEDWTGGYVKTLSWNVTDPDDPLSALTTDVFYSTNGGSSWIGIVAGLPGSTTTYDWLVPFVNTTIAKVKVCTKDPMNNTGCGLSGLFTIDSASPTVASTIPPDGAIDIPLNQTAMVYWNEAMNSANGSFAFNPTMAGNSNWNTGRTMVEFIPTTLLSTCTDYSVNLTGFTDESDPGNAMAGTYAFSFKTICPGPPHVTLLRPVGGEYWRGGSSQLINWTAFDAETSFKNLTFIVNYSSSVSSGTIVGPVKMLTAYLWTVPSIDATDVRINVTVIDLDSMSGFAESGMFTIDSTPPSLSSHVPTGWNVPVDSSVSVTFTEPVMAAMNRTDLAIALRDGGTGQWVLASRAPSGFTSFMQLVPNQPLKQCTAYDAFLNDTFIDRASWTLTNPTSWTFHTVCPPSLSFQTAMAGKDWTGGSSHNLAWTMGDEIDTQLKVWINYSKDDGADGYPHAIYSGTRPTGANVYAWTLPLIDTEKARVKITVADSSGIVVSTITANFTIDSTPPSILSSVPSGGSHGIKITDSIQVVFTEAIVRSSAEQSFSLSPNPGGIGFSWQRTTSGKDIMIVDHKPLSQKTDYTVTYSTTIRDVSDPGKHPASALTIHFSTKPPPPVNPPVAKAVGHNQIAVGEETTFDGSQSTGNITKYVWTITDNQNNIVEVLEGKVVTYTFSQNGRYRVTLRVIDEPSGVWDEDYIEINVTSSVNAGAIILLSSALIAAAAIGGTEVGRVALFMLLAVPVYKRKMKGKDDVETRGMVIGYVRVHPGDTFTDIKTNLGLHNGSATWHLMKLEKDGIIKSQIRGSKRLYFPANMPLPFEDGGDLHEIEKRMLQMVKTDPGMTVKVLAEELGVSSQLALYHMRKLSQKGLVSLERRGLRLKVYPPPPRNA